MATEGGQRRGDGSRRVIAKGLVCPALRLTCLKTAWATLLCSQALKGVMLILDGLLLHPIPFNITSLPKYHATVRLGAWGLHREVKKSSRFSA